VAASGASRPPTPERSGSAALADRLLALTRESGSPGLNEARALVAARLEGLGYRVETQPFRCTAAALVPLPLAGAGLGWLALALAPLLALSAPPPWLPLAVWAVGALSLALVALGAAGGHGPAAWAGPLRDDANLIATRSPDVRRWIVAHLDTKAQGHSMAGRLVAVWLMVAAVLALTALCLLRLGGPLPAWAAGTAAAMGVLAGALAARGRLEGATPGARDNGTGVLAALAAAERLRDPTVGVLITGAEELGLVGARLLVRDRRALLTGAEVVNFDTLDDRGPLWVVHHDARGRALAEREAARLAALGYVVRRRQLPLGILTDSLAFARMGVPAITIARLDWRTLRTIHTPADHPTGLSLATAERLGAALAG
jgi:hypothetical protein